jgi:hypothetical protein
MMGFVKIGTHPNKAKTVSSTMPKTDPPGPRYNIDKMDQETNSYRRKDINADKSETGNKDKTTTTNWT